MGDRIRRACRKDKNLIPTIKAEWNEARGEDVPLPPLFPKLSWLNKAWEKAGKPPGRPFKAAMHYVLAHEVHGLEFLGLSRTEVLDVINAPREAEVWGKETRSYRGIPNEKLWDLGERARQNIFQFTSVSKDGKCNGKIPLEADFRAEEISRSVRWAERQWSDPRARLRGQRVWPSKKRSHEHPSSGRPSVPPR